jgi:hypothetical protein
VVRISYCMLFFLLFLSIFGRAGLFLGLGLESWWEGGLGQCQVVSRDC